MKKIGVVSCYFQHNYGSMLQAYATQMFLDKTGCENETINIKKINKSLWSKKIKFFAKAAFTSDILKEKAGRAGSIIRKKLLKGKYAENLKIRADKFDAFKEKYFSLSEEYDSLEQLGAVCEDKYSCVVVGSDQLWLPANIEADYYTLNFVPETVNTVAYSTSFGVSELPSAQAEKAKHFLKKIKHISVREESGKKLTKALSGRDVPVVCDPTLLFTGEDWMCIQKEEPLVKEPYIFCYFLGKNSMPRKFAQEIKKLTGLKIVALTHIDEYVKIDEQYADETPYDVDPSDFLNLIRNAQYICTDSFHCSVFSILYKKKFFTFRRFIRKTKQSTNSRLDTLFNLIGIKDRLIDCEVNIEDYLEKEIDYAQAHENLENLRKKSYQYINDAIINERNTDL